MYTQPVGFPLFSRSFPLPLMAGQMSATTTVALSSSPPPSPASVTRHTVSSYPVAPATALHAAVNPAAFVALAHAAVGAGSSTPTTWNVTHTGNASSHSAFPACLAVTVTSPVPVNVSVPVASSSTAGPSSTTNVTGSPLIAVAESATVAVSSTGPTIYVKSMSCSAFSTANVRVTLAAASHASFPAWLAVTVTGPAPVNDRIPLVSTALPVTV